MHADELKPAKNLKPLINELKPSGIEKDYEDYERYEKYEEYEKYKLLTPILQNTNLIDNGQLTIDNEKKMEKLKIKEGK